MFFQETLILEAKSPRLRAVLYLQGQTLGVCSPRARPWVRLWERRHACSGLYVKGTLGPMRTAGQGFQSRGEISTVICFVVTAAGLPLPSLPQCPAPEGKPHSSLTQLGRGLGLSAGLVLHLLCCWPYSWWSTCDHCEGPIIGMLSHVNTLSSFWYSFKMGSGGRGEGGEEREDRFLNI